jgi:acyl-CoA hydrolase/GNAT superfamily N-acetyltransferase
MTETIYWADKYAGARRTAEEAVAMIRNGQRVFIGSSCGEPQHLVRALSDVSRRFTDLEILRLMALETTPLTLIANDSGDQTMNIRSFYLGSAKPASLAKNKRFITPMNLSALPRLFKTRQMPIHVAVIQVCPPDDFGWLSLGVSVDITLSAALSADLVIAQVNPRMPRVLGHSFIHVNDVDVFVEHEEPLITIDKSFEMESANAIGRLIARLIDDGSTMQISPGTTLQATLTALSNRNDLGIHTQYLTPEIMHLVAKGVVTNRNKGLNEGKLVASSAIGNEALYEFINDNPSIEFHPSDYVNDPSVIARHNKMVSLNVAMAMDLTGQVAADALPHNHFSGVTGMLDFIRGAAQAKDGKSILMLPTTDRSGKISRIVSTLDDTAIVVPRGDVQYVVTEYGAVNLFGKSLQERALAMISIAHPDFRDDLFHEAKAMGLFHSARSFKESIHSVYPVELEDVLEIDRQEIIIRPAKPVDARRIQEHFYNLDRSDVVSRFFHEKTSFLRKEMDDLAQIDYINNLTLLAVIGEFGFGKVVAVGEYLFDEVNKIAEVAFSVSSEWQGKGLGKILMTRLAAAAKKNGIESFLAFTSTSNRGMQRLFQGLPYKAKKTYEDDMLILKCRFDEPEDENTE